MSWSQKETELNDPPKFIVAPPKEKLPSLITPKKNKSLLSEDFFNPEIDFEKSYLWYSVSVSAGVYKAMKLRDRVGELIDKKKINELQVEANEIFTKNKYFGNKGENNDI